MTTETAEKPGSKRLTKSKVRAIVREELKEVKQEVADKPTPAKISSPNGRVPGQINPDRKTKTAWTMKDLENKYGLVTFTPESREWVEVNGVGVMLEAGREVTLPKCFEGVLKDASKALREAMQKRRTQFQEVGALSPDSED